MADSKTSRRQKLTPAQQRDLECERANRLAEKVRTAQRSLKDIWETTTIEVIHRIAWQTLKDLAS